MRRRSAVAIAALVAAVALAGLPAPAGSTAPSVPREPAPAAFTRVTIPADALAAGAPGAPDAALRSDAYIDATSALTEPGGGSGLPADRPAVDEPASPAGHDWKTPRQVLTGWATFYDNGTTAMRLPRGTVVRICGAGGCIERVVSDYGPQKPSRVVDMYRPDFFAICGCGWYSGTTWVTVSVY